MKAKRSRWLFWQRGQAMTEYWPTIPVGIMILLVASGLSSFISGSFLQTMEGLDPAGLKCSDQEEATNEGPSDTFLGCHTIELVVNSYNEEADQTTVGYRVTSRCDPAISHWSLGLPKSVADNILSSSEAIEPYGTDPTTGTTGIKFDRGFDSGGGNDDGNNDGGGNGNNNGGNGNNNGGGNGKNKNKSMDTIMLSSTNARGIEEHMILLTLAGHYTWSNTEVSIKAGTQVYHSVISAPSALADNNPEQNQCEE